MTFTDAFCVYCGEPAPRRQAGKPLCQTRHDGMIAQNRQEMGKTVDQFLADLGAVPKHNWCRLFICTLRRLEELDGSNIGWLLAEIEAEIAQKIQHGTWHG